MKKSMFKAAAAFAAAAFAAGAAEIYTVTESITSGGIDLTTLGGEYRQDAIAGRAAGANLPIAITGRVVHASGLTPQNPFIVSNAVASSYFILKDADLVGKTPVEVRGAGITYFPDTTLTNDSEEANGLFRARSGAQIDNLYITGKDTHGTMFMTNGTFYVRYNTYIGHDGYGSLYTTVTSLGRGNNSGNDNLWLGSRSNSKLYLGVSATPGVFSQGKLYAKNVYVRGWDVYFGGEKTAAPPDDGEEHYAADVTLAGSDACLWLLCSHVDGAADSIIRFRGGRMWSEGWGTYIEFRSTCSGNLICQGETGNAINLAMTKYSPFVTWAAGATGHLIMRGNCDVILYGGDGQGQGQNFTLESGGNYYNKEGGVSYIDTDHRIEWLQTGDLKFSASGGRVAKIGTSYFFPSNSWNGGVSIGNSSTFYVNLVGTSQACNSLFGGGKLTNGVLTKASTIYIGSHGNACEFDATLCAGGAINIVKRGTGAIALMKPIPYTFTLEQGAALIPTNSTFTTPGSLVTAAGTYFALQGSMFTPPADYDMNDATTATFVPTMGGVLVLGGDGADQTVDFSKISGDGVVRKVGANTVTLVNASGFTGTLDVQGGTLALAASAGTVNLASVTVAADTTLSLAGGVLVNAGSLTARGVSGTPETSYGGAEGATAIAGISGEGSVYIVPLSATWTGAVDDDPENLANWTGLSSADALFTGLLTVNFSASDPVGAWNVTKAYSLKGMNFAAGVTSFSFNKSSNAAKLSIGLGGISITDTRSSASWFDFYTPIDFLATWSTLDIGTNVSARFHAPLGGVDNGGQTVGKIGGGSVYLYTTNSTYDGSMAVSNGIVYAYGNEPFGPMNAAGTSEILMYRPGGTASVCLSNVTTSKGFYLWNTDSARPGFYSMSGTTNVVGGRVHCGHGACGLQAEAGSVLYFDGGYGTASNPGGEYVNWGGAGTVVFRKKPLYCGTFECGLSNLRLDCPGNKITKVTNWNTSVDPFPCNYNNIFFGHDFALDSTSTRIFTGAVIDLGGTEQRIGALRVNGTLRSLGKAGTLRLACTDKNFYAVTPSTGDFVGSVNLIVEADNAFTFGISNRVVSATGNVEVVRGTLKFCGTASWLNATNVTVSGGTLVVPHSKTFGRYSELHLKAGALQLGAGVEQKVKFLYLDGSEKRARVGRYGAVDNMSVPAANRTARITGPGVLNVMGEFSGSVLMFK